MIIDDARLTVLRRIMEVRVRSVWPDEAGVFAVVWTACLSESLAHGDVRWSGLPAARASEPLDTALLTLTVFAVLRADANPHDVAFDQIEEMSRAAAARKGLAGARLDKVAKHAASVVHEFLRTIDSPSGAPLPAERLQEVAFAEELRKGERSSARAINVLELAGLRREAGVDLLVDELDGCVRGRKQTRLLDSMSGRARSGLWLFLVHAGATFQTSDISRVVRGRERDIYLAGLRKYPNEARVLLADLIGSEVVSRSQGGVYFVPRSGWSWAWIRKASDPKESVLLSAHGIRE